MKKNLMITICVFVLAACQSVAPSPTSTPQPTDTPIPTSTSTPTPIPTKTPIPPTPTVEPPSVLSNYLADIRVVKIDNFDNANGWDTYNSQTGKISDGAFVITGQPNWSSGLVRKNKFNEGQGFVFEFKYEKGTKFAFMLESGDWQTDSYRAIGVYGHGYPKAFLIQGNNDIGGNNLFGNFVPKSENWYTYMGGIGDDGSLISIIWDPLDPSKVITYKETIGKKWDNLNWQFTAKVTDKGMILYIDNFAEISFSAIK